MPLLEGGKCHIHIKETHEKTHSDERSLGQTRVVTLLTSRQLLELRTDEIKKVASTHFMETGLDKHL